MIAFNLSVPVEVKNEIISKRSDTFMIITSSPMRNNMQYFLAANEDDMLLLTLKFGKENVWKR